MSPVRHRLRQLAAAERLLGFVESAREYPLEFVTFSLTGYRPRRSGTSSALPGADLIADLVLLIESLSSSAPLADASAGGALLRADQLESRLHVCGRTLSRWRSRGLCGRWYVAPEGRPYLAYSIDSVHRFLRKQAELVRRAGRFQVMTVAERAAIVARARALLAEEPQSIHALARRIASETGRATETIRVLLRRAIEPIELDADCAAFDRTPDTDGELLAAVRAGEDTASLAQRLVQPREAIEAAIARARAREIAERPIEYVHSDVFDAPDAEAMILGGPGDGPVEDVLRERPDGRVPDSLGPSLVACYRVPLLTAAGERELFRRYNYLKFRAERVRQAIRPLTPSDAAVAEVREWLTRAARVKAAIVEANLRLVISIAKRHVRGLHGVALADLIGEGNISLLHAIDRFDYSRGFRFSTYATWVITRRLARVVPDSIQWQRRHRTGAAATMEPVDAPASDEPRREPNADMARLLRQAVSELDPRERTVLERYFGLAAASNSPVTLDEVGVELGISKERTRQIKERALRKLRRVLATHHLEHSFGDADE
ncbi:MAG: sigma-70 family RNA polymerase sigma factor [Phycisphaerae bacterium]|nr:sigma-70 family RNA polymerase sigma factor [Phycisphaerae bacterium]